MKKLKTLTPHQQLHQGLHMLLAKQTKWSKYNFIHCVLFYDMSTTPSLLHILWHAGGPNHHEREWVDTNKKGNSYIKYIITN
jgi:hypothetical protein